MKLQTEKYVDGNEFSLQDQDGNEVGKIQVPYDVTDDDHSTQELAELIVERFNGFEDLKDENDDLKAMLSEVAENIDRWMGGNTITNDIKEFLSRHQG